VTSGFFNLEVTGFDLFSSSVHMVARALGLNGSGLSFSSCSTYICGQRKEFTINEGLTIRWFEVLRF
jgi:hypothetical protein